jgi:5'-nucleotidase
MTSTKIKKNRQAFFAAYHLRSLVLVIVYVALGLAFLASRPGAVRAEDHNFQLAVMHVNDTHGHIAPVGMRIHYKGRKIFLDVGGFPRLATKVSAVRISSQSSVLLHGGDVFQGTLYFTKFKGLAHAEFMNLLGFDAMVTGNHEFDKGSDVLARFLKKAEFPVLAANIDFSRSAKLQGRIAPYIVKKLNGNQVAIVGLAPPETPWISSPEKNLVFGDPIATTKNIVERLEAKGINKIIILSHIGYEEDLKLARAVDGIDLVVGGHSHTRLGDFDELGLSSKGSYPARVQTPSGTPAYVVQAWQWTQVLGIVIVSFDDYGKVVSCEGSPVMLSGDTFWTKSRNGTRVDLKHDETIELLRFIHASPVMETVAEDPVAKSRLAFYDTGLEALKSEVIATVAEDLMHVRVPGRIHPGTGTASRGSDVAPLVAQSMLWKSQSAGLPVQAVIQNAGGIRADLSQGPLTAAQVYELLPFGNTLYLFRLTGKDMRTALENGVSRSKGAFPYVAGIRYKADPAGPKGNRIMHVEIKTDDGTWKTINEKTEYLVCTNSYLASGGNGYDIFKKASTYAYDTGFVDTEVFIEYAKHMTVIRRPVDTGITIVR